MAEPLLPSDYLSFLGLCKTQIEQAQLRAISAANKELILLYWHIGREILQRQQDANWNAEAIDKLFQDLHKEFPHMRGLSPSNLKYMRLFAETYPDEQFVQQVATQLSWTYHRILLDKVKNSRERQWYMLQVIEHTWSHNTLETQIETKLYRRLGDARAELLIIY